MFYKRDIYYTSGFMSGSSIITSGDDYVYSANELFIIHFLRQISIWVMIRAKPIKFE